MLDSSAEHTVLTVPPTPEMRSCVGLVLAGMAARAHIGVGNLEDAVDLLEGFHEADRPTRFRFSLRDDGVVAQVEQEVDRSTHWRTVVELVS